jgi:glycosyltransferase involved in cell wall biosynthesis
MVNVAMNAWFWERPDVGMGMYLRCLVGALAERGRQEDKGTGRQGDRAHRLTLVVPVGVDGVPDGVQCLVVKPPFADPMGHVARLWFEQWGFPRACQKLKADVAHVPHYGASGWLPCPQVVTVHDLILWQMPAYSRPLLLSAYRHLIRATARRATHIITDSNFTRQQVVTDWEIGEEKVTAIHLAPAPIFHPALSVGNLQPSPLLRGEGTGYLLYVGGYDVRKNVAMLLRAYAEMPASFRQKHPLVLAGKIPETHTVYQDPRPQIQQLGLSNDVKLIGWVASQDLPSLYAKATLFLYPSRYEGFGFPVLEAMACGVPVLTSNVTSLPEIAGNCAILLDPADGKSWRDTIMKVCQDPGTRQKWVQCGYEHVLKFTWQKTAQQTADIYTSVAKQ